MLELALRKCRILFFGGGRDIDGWTIQFQENIGIEEM